MIGKRRREIRNFSCNLRYQGLSVREVIQVNDVKRIQMKVMQFYSNALPEMKDRIRPMIFKLFNHYLALVKLPPDLHMSFHEEIEP